MPTSFDQLLAKFLRDALNTEERADFLVQVKLPENAKVLGDMLEKDLTSKQYSGLSKGMDLEARFSEMMERAKNIEEEEKLIPITRNRRRWITPLSAAAAVVLLLVSSYLLFFRNDQPKPEQMEAVAKDVDAPRNNRAQVSLADGTIIYLDSASNGKLAQQGSVKLVKLADGKIVYQYEDGAIVPEQYNTLTNPRGSKVVDISLADGSHVWLNAGSSITYPIAFAGKERKLSMTGEAYFEVAKDASKPFIVSKDALHLEVLGTHFNVNTYDDEADIKVTLLEGSVNVNGTIIKPGQQAVLSNKVKLVSDVDIEQVMAWKNGLFNFSEASVEEVMRQVARWYDVEVIYEARTNDKFQGGMNRAENLSKVLKMLEATDAVHFNVEGKKVFVLK